MSNRFVVPAFGVGFLLLLAYASYLQWQIWQGL